MNRIVLVGRLENTPEIRYTSSGIPVSNFSLSVRRSHPNSEGIWERDVFRIVTWRKLAETCCKYLERGRWIAVDGKLQNRFITTSSNERRVMVEIHADDIRFLDFRQQKDRDTARTTDQAKHENSEEQRIETPVESVGPKPKEPDNGKRMDDEEDFEADVEMMSPQSGHADRDSDAYKPYLEDEEGTPLDLSDV
ncbi:MAG: single-stranded DNA-binding protein [bacterium]